MVKGMRILTLLGLMLASSSHSFVEATTSISSRSSRRLTTQRIRGLKLSSDEGGVKKTRGLPRPPLPGEVSRPVPETFKKAGINLKPAKESDKPFKLPESKQAVNLKVNKKDGDRQYLASGLGTIGKKKEAVEKKEVEVENGLEHFQEVDEEVYRRHVPSFSVKFLVEDSSSNDPNLADFNELSEVCEEYLDKYFSSVFEDEKVRHRETALILLPSEEDPYTVDFQLTLAFLIPGEVPTINFLLARLTDGLEKDISMAFMIADLSVMSETNPFSKTSSFEVTSRPPVSAAEMDRTGGKPQVPGIEQVGSNYLLVSLLAGAGCVVLLGTGLMWRKQKSKRGAVSDSNEAFSLFDKSNKKDASGSPKISGIYGADEETMNYLNSIRKRYRDNGGSRKSSSADNIAVMEQSGSYDDSMCDSVDSDFDIEKKNDVEDDLRSIN